ncbi:cytochrome P450 [Macrolepiota fuliginosa MF-IS2]|uniref:Cytochrome P450 n=1 Tax=Macrolepiota fuliginosa MF-IS2 TaxID=1400762 RepID=A0A9P6C2J6_9AGAR|nr:cytochrome P450 [Macrolepiota fuliginosa MF-IS2]
MVFLKVFDRSMIVINDVKVAQDLLDKRSALYSSRPRPKMLVDVMKIDYIFAFMPYGEEWRTHRRLFQQYFSSRNVDTEQTAQLDFIRKGLLVNLYESPQKFPEHILNCIGGLIFATTYGLTIQRNKDPNVDLQEYVYGISEGAAMPGRFLVDIIPWLKYVPEWMPGAGFKTLGRQWTKLLHRAMNEPYEAALKVIDDGTARECLVSWTLKQHRDQPGFDSIQERRIKQTAAVTYKAGTDTRVAALLTFVIAMLTHPDIQRKAQAEIDAVIGLGRLPDSSDIPHLPYLSAVVKELLRWNPITPLGIPHVTSNEDVYGGIYIPKDCIVFANAYAMLHDEENFPDPEEFKPERFMRDGKLRTDVLDPETTATFGFGRRICPGARIALSTVYLAIASILAAFDILPDLDSEERPIKVEPKFFNSSIVSQPLPFPCRIVPRQDRNVDGLLKEYMGHDFI